jgi:hypothetical protein
VRKIDPLGNVETFLNSTLYTAAFGFDINSKLLILDRTIDTIARRLDRNSFSVVKSGFYTAKSIAADLLGNIFFVQIFTHTLHWIDSGNNKRQIAGVYETPGYIDGVGSNARFSLPIAMVFDSKGRLLIADQNNNAIRMVTWS